ncbi:ankyrin repeat domain-containing protein 49 [Syngnathoides biaculeatus]|uniref:ankyrin repeat domain-containing protein 49 n=1 Tax=Syngnathoides biaculeatus TaxID=300417 RepID=UPI002ADE7411|nr:ankyrin repeat domain-containing protein 49 [Syngnathoides biaculeatus]
MEFPDDFNQLELVNTHGKLIPRGSCGLWTGSEDEDGPVEDEEAQSEERYLRKEESLRDRPAELVLWAAQNNRVSTILRLLSAEASLAHSSDEDAYTPLHRAAYGGHADAAASLLAAGSRVNPRTVDGWTPLHSACRWGHVAVATLLLHHGADVNAQTDGGLTPLHLAASHGSSRKAGWRHTLELLLSQRHLRAGLGSDGGERAGELARRCGPYHFLFEMVEDCASVLPGP